MMTNKKIASLGVALFAMFFGAGNVIFPLDLGRVMGDRVWFALAGLFLSAVIMPLIGVFAGAFFDGNYKEFFGRIGTIPGELLTLVSMITIGAMGAIPRTLTLSHAAFAYYFPAFPLFPFTVLAGAIIIYFTLKEGKVIDVIGQFLGPIKITLLTAVIVSGFFAPFALQTTNFSFLQSFSRGLIEGYYTLDLLCAIFFARLIFSSVDKEAYSDNASLLKDLLKAGSIGALLLGVVYAGFMVTSALHGAQVGAVGRDQLIFALGDFLLGRLGILVSFTVAIACLTTAIALTAVFADYMSSDLFRNRVSYKICVFISVFVTCAFANLGFEGVMKNIIPVAIVCYPAMIVLAVLNIAYKTVGFKPVKTPVFIAFAVSLVRYLGWI